MVIIRPPAFVCRSVTVLALAGLLVACSDVDILPDGCARSPTRTCLSKHAINLALSIKDSEERDDALGDIAERQAIAGNFESARKTIELIKDDQKRLVMTMFAAHRREASTPPDTPANQLAKARERVRAASNPTSRVDALREVAGLQHSQGLVADATATVELAIAAAQAIKDPKERADRLASIALELVDRGQIGQALPVLEKARGAAQAIEDEDLRASMLSGVADAQVNAGDLAAALATARMAKQTSDVARTLAYIAGEQARRGMTEEAFETARTIADDRIRNDAFAAIAVGQVKAGNIDPALETLKGISHEYDHANALRQVVGALCKVGNFVRALVVARSARESDRATAFTDIAEAQAKAALIADAHATIRLIEDDYDRDSALAKVATVWTDAGNHTAALEAAGMIKRGEIRAKTLKEIISAKAEPTALAVAIEIARTLLDEPHDVAFAAIAEAQGKLGQITAALETAKTVKSRRYRAVAFGGIAERLTT
jgi:tetratricopeptide (TPR) repeat protein